MPWLAMIAGFLFPGWSGLRLGIVAAVAAVVLLGGTGLAWKWRADFAARIRAEERAKADKALLEAWSRASEKLAAAEANKRRIVAQLHALLAAEREQTEQIIDDYRREEGARDASGIHGKFIR